MSPRTKSCALCRKKRIKCDATRPRCLTCARFGRECPGVEADLLIIDMTSAAKHGMRRRKQKTLVLEAPSVSEQEQGLPHTTEEPAVGRMSQDLVMAQAFYARFLAHFTFDGEGSDIRNQLTWLDRLAILSCDGTNDALGLSVRAAASAYCALESSNLALARYAWDLYGRALKGHGRLLAQLPSANEITVHMVSTSVLFSLFEAMQAASPTAYRSHVYGVQRMLEMARPRECSQGVLCQIFYHIRTQLAFVRLTGGDEAATQFNVKSVLYRTLQYMQIPIFQRLMSHITTLVDIFVAPQQNEVIAASRSEICESVIRELESLWGEYVDGCQDETLPIYWRNSITGVVGYRDAYTAMTISYFNSARIISLLIAPQLVLSCWSIANQCSSILNAAQYLRVDEIGCAYIRMAMPLLLVALHSPKPTESRMAIESFERWLSGSLRGISALALSKIHQHYGLVVTKSPALNQVSR